MYEIHLLTFHSTRETKCEPLFESYFFSIPVYILKRKRAKFGQTERKHEKNSSLHRSRIPYFIVQRDIRASRSHSQSHNNGKSSEAYKETFLRNRSLEREFLRTLLNKLRTLGIDLGCFPLYRTDRSETTRTNQGKMERVRTKSSTELIVG